MDSEARTRLAASPPKPSGPKVILVNPPIRLPEDFAHYPTFSTLGLLSNAAWLRAAGRRVEIVDAFTMTPRLNLHSDGENMRHMGAEIVDLVSALRERVEADETVAVVVALTMFSDLNRPHDTLIPDVVRAIRAELPEVSLGLASLFICGMNYFPIDAAKMLAELEPVDWMLMGEGEPTLGALLQRIESGDSLEGLPSVASRKDGEVLYDPSAPKSIKELDEFPLPAFDLLDMDNYFSCHADAIKAELVHEYHEVERQLPLMTSRSCPFRCSFCTNQVLSLPWRAHSVEYVEATIDILRERYGVDRFLFLDDNINVNEKRFRTLVRMLAGSGVPWDAVNGYRADHLDREMVQAIKRAGNSKITVSAESGDPALLNEVIGKRLKLPTVVKLAKICEEERIPLQVHYIIGVPGETREQINKTLEFCTVLLEKHGAWPLLQHAIPFPGTRLYQSCEENGYFVKPPAEVPAAMIEVRGIIETPEFTPDQVWRMRRNASHLHRSTTALPFIEVETRCSNRCASCHCDPARRDKTRPSLEEVEASLERALFFGGREVFFGGGEPTLREDLPEIVAKARSMGFRSIALLSNAHGLANAAYAERLLSERVDRLVVDLHGSEAELHDAIADRERSFAGTVAGLRRARAAGVQIEANVSIVRKNLHDLPRIVRRALQLGARGVHLGLPAPDSRAAKEGEIPLWEQARPWLVKALAAASEGTVNIQGVPLCLLP
ncbi:MAG: radical SAM protein, partial [Myxococcales bacterium]|nr:radical SAM protein [Myxococcales bacterium]